jgi:AbrB family looped-hinge helix DNA binding protein
MRDHKIALRYPTTIKMGAKGQPTIPKQVRDGLGLETGAPVAFLQLGDGLILLPAQRYFEHLRERVRSTLGTAGVTADDLLATLPTARSLVYAQRYGNELSVRNPRRGPRHHFGK